MSNRPYFPFELRRVILVKTKEKQVTAQVIIEREGGKAGGKLKKIAIDFDSAVLALSWGSAFNHVIFGGFWYFTVGQPTALSDKYILIMVEKSDIKKQTKVIEDYMKEVFDAANRSYEIKCNILLIKPSNTMNLALRMPFLKKILRRYQPLLLWIQTSFRDCNKFWFVIDIAKAPSLSPAKRILSMLL